MQQQDEMKAAFTRRLDEALVRAGEMGYLTPARNGNITNKQLTQALAEHGCKISEPGVWKWRNGAAVPDNEKMRILSQLLHVSSEWLTYGSHQIPTANTDQNVIYHQQYRQGKAYPLISWVSAGNWLEAIEPYDLSDIDIWPDTTAIVSPRSFWLTVKGDSMTAPTGRSIPEGTLILIDPEREAVNGSLVVAKLENENEATFKQYVQDAGQHYLKPLNPNYRMLMIDKTCRIIGVAIEAKLQLE